MALATLKKRPEFLAVRGGARASVASFLMEARPRSGSRNPAKGPRFGFTVTKKLGGAVIRNRIRRRLKSAVSEVAAEAARDGFDYVIVARAAALGRAYQDLLGDVRRAFSLIHKGPGLRPKDHANAKPGSVQPGQGPKIS